MRDNTFTRGPWIAPTYSSVLGAPVLATSGRPIAKVTYFNLPDGFENHERESTANAQLIAAAPDMYDALWEIIELSDRNLTEAGRTPEFQRVYDIVRAALRKAEGE